MSINKPARIAFIGASAGTRVRILLQHEFSWHGLFWFKLGRDGSIYFGPRYKPTGESSFVRKSKVGTSFEIHQDDLIEVTDPKLVRHSRTTVHPSGAINLAGHRFQREPLRNFFEQELVCSVLFERPDNYPIITKQSSKTIDIKLIYPVDYSRPLIGELYISPKGRERYILSPKALYQVNPIVQFTGFEDGIDRSCQFVLYHINESMWPDATYIITPAGKRVLRERVRRLFVRLKSRWDKH